MIEKSMKQVNFSVKPNRNAKQQALEVIPKLRTVIPLERSQMQLKVMCHKKHKQKLKELASEVESERVTEDGTFEIVSDKQN